VCSLVPFQKHLESSEAQDKSASCEHLFKRALTSFFVLLHLLWFRLWVVSLHKFLLLLSFSLFEKLVVPVDCSPQREVGHLIIISFNRSEELFRLLEVKKGILWGANVDLELSQVL